MAILYYKVSTLITAMATTTTTTTTSTTTRETQVQQGLAYIWISGTRAIITLGSVYAKY